MLFGEIPEIQRAEFDSRQREARNYELRGLKTFIRLRRHEALSGHVALKRPFDDQTQGRILIETLAVMRILDAASTGTLQLCNSAALEFENQQNPDAQRRQRVATLLRWIGRPAPATARLLARSADIARLGFRDMDALHLAFAEHLKADYFVTVDDEILARSQQVRLPVKLLDAVELVKELGL